jgi:hypothetical protein
VLTITQTWKALITWSWDSNVLFSTFHTNEFEATLLQLRNFTAISINNINVAVASAMVNSKNSYRTAKEYTKDIKLIRLSDYKAITSVGERHAIVVLKFHHTLFNHCFPCTNQGGGLRCPVEDYNDQINHQKN